MSTLSKQLRVLGALLLVFGTVWLIVALGRRGRALPSDELVVRVRDDSGEPLAEVPVFCSGAAPRAVTPSSGQQLGVTDAQGALRGSRAALARARRIRVQCPEAYRVAAAQTFDPGASNASLIFVCRPKQRTLALVVHAPSARGLLLRADAQTLGRIDAQGLLHAVLRRPPGSTVSLSLVARPEESSLLVPAQKLVVEDRDQIVLFEPVLSVR